jgi:two-component system, OmpR family, phosphate regulon sensor histidine kinase PhoR
MELPRLNFFWRSNLAILVLLFIVLAAGDLYSWRSVRNQEQEAGFEDLAAMASFARSHPPDVNDPPALHRWIGEIAASGAEVALIRSDGETLAASASDSTIGLKDLELQQALSSGQGRAIRHSNSLNRDVLYYAVSLPTASSQTSTAPRATSATYVRLSRPLADVDQQFAAMRRPVWTFFLILFASAITLALLDLRSTSRRIRSLKQFASRMAAGDFRPVNAASGGDALEELAVTLNQSAARLNAGISVLTDERNRSAAILSSMIEGVAVISGDERILFSNAAFSRILGLDDVQQIEGRPLLEVARQSDLLAAIKMALSGQEQVTSEIVVGTVRPRSFAVTAAPVQASSHKGAVLVLHEITELRRLERVRQDFVANVSHEFRTPLTAIQGFAETLLSGALEDPANRRRFVEIIREHATRLARLTEDLLKLSRIEAGQLKLEFRPVSVAQLIESCVETAHFKAVPRQLAVSVHLPDELPAVRGDSNNLQEVLQNLLDNALQYTPAGGKIDVSASCSDGRVIVTVADTGIGIPQVEQERIFERFYRVDAARSREAGGTGLGLSIARHIMEAHGGRLWVESAVGEGSRFHFSIPVVN